MNKVNVGLVGYGTVGSGVLQYFKNQKSLFKNKYDTEFVLKVLCDRSIDKKDTHPFTGTILTKDFNDVLNNNEVEVVVELIGGMQPAKDIVFGALKKGKDVITANKELIANCGQELFKLAQEQKKDLYFESSVGAGIPIIKTISEGIAGNKFKSI